MRTIYARVATAAADILWLHDLPPESQVALGVELNLLDAPATAARAALGQRAWVLDNITRHGRAAIIGTLQGSAFPPDPVTCAVTEPLMKLQEMYYLHSSTRALRRTARTAEPYAQVSPNVWLGPLDFSPKGAFLAERDLPKAEGQLLTRVRQIQITLALGDYHRLHGSYPSRLVELGRALPRDPFSGNEFVYRRQGDKYVLYGVGPNGVDDGGRPVSRDVPVQYSDTVWGRP